VFLRTGVGKDIAAGTDDATRSETPTDNRVPEAPFWGARVCRDIPLDEIFALLDLDELYRLQWGARGSGPKYEATVRDEFEPARLRLQADAAANGWLQPRAVYGYFPVQSSGNDLIVYDPAAYGSDGGSLREIARFKYPRMVGRERLCLADYFRSVESGDVDVAAFQVVTVGDEASRRFEELQGRGEYSEAYYVHGLAVEAAEAVAMWMHQRIRRELGISDEQGKRYSWGYGACPDLDDHETVFRILPVAETIGVTLTTAFQLMPEQSTAAMIVHHPAAKYYAVRGVQEQGSVGVAEPSVATAS
jgi:5-methyltetrahydrofolate--homocysteine methyltransferase